MTFVEKLDFLIRNQNNTVQYRPSEKKIVFGLKVPPGDGWFRLNFMIEIVKKCFNEL